MTGDSSLDRSRPPVHLHVGTERLSTGSGGVWDHVDPATGEIDQQVPLGGRPEIDSAVQAAHEAFHTWRRTPPAQRRALLLRLADLIEAHGNEFARRDILDNAVPISVSGGLIPRAADWTRYYAGFADK